MILGTGIDLVEVDRIRNSYARFGDRFISRILRPSEIAYCLKHRDPGPPLAVRFAAKEAISKAFGTGISPSLGWHDMEISRKETGEPFVILHDAGLQLLEARRGRKIHLSLSHTLTYATAVAVLEG